MLRKSKLLLKAIDWFGQGENVVQMARQKLEGEYRDQDIIEIAYDLQAGSYIANLTDPKMLTHKEEWGQRIADILRSLGVSSACEAGTGEATTLAFIAGAAGSEVTFSGFDISLSRTLHARDFLARNGVEARLFCADILRIPLPDSSVDAVITNHSIEPNGGFERPLLEELFRVCARYLVLVEPDYERGTEEQKKRMREHNYVRGIAGHLEHLPGRLRTYEGWPLNVNPHNKASLFVFEKRDGTRPSSEFDFVSPVNRRPLAEVGGELFCASEGLVYPTVLGIPILRDECAVVCTQADRFG